MTAHDSRKPPREIRADLQADSPAKLAAQVARAATILRAGGLVALPTETVYGLGADAGNATAVDRLFAVKGRPAGHPLIVHLGNAGQIALHARDVPPAAHTLAEKFWPGPLTMILKLGSGIATKVTGGLPTVGLRVPDHPVALAILSAFGGPVAAPSANRFGAVSPTTAAHVRDALGEAIDLVVDGGPCRVGVESTIIDLSQDRPRVLRPGGITVEQLEATLGVPVPVADKFDPDGEVRAPGTLPSHYAPRARVALCRPEEMAAEVAAALDRGQKAGVLTAFAPANLPADVVRIRLPADPEGAAATLYESLREVDRQNLDVVFACLPPEGGVGRAVADRLRRAAGPRSETS